MFRKRILLFIILAVILLAGLVFFLASKDQGNVELKTVPNDAMVEFKKNDGSTVSREGSGSLSVGRGDYVVTAQKEGFLPKSVSLAIESDKEKQTIVLALEPSSEDAKKWAEKNNKQYQEAEGVAGGLNQASGAEFRSDNPIISSLPYNSGFYMINYGIDRKNNDAFKIIISADSPNKRQVALEKVRELGYDPSDFIIEFKGVDNIFTESIR